MRGMDHYSGSKGVYATSTNEVEDSFKICPLSSTIQAIQTSDSGDSDRTRTSSRLMLWVETLLVSCGHRLLELVNC